MSITQAIAAVKAALSKEAKPMHALARPADFYKTARLVTGPLDQTQVSTVNALLKAAHHWPLAWVAYALATAFHECRLRPIHEMGGAKYLAKYDTGTLAKALGNTPQADGDGIKYAGRGLVQLTGRRNYEKAGKALGLNLLADPDLALDPVNATRITVWGMEGGHFTGRSLADYLPGWRGSLEQYKNARRIINGTDKASLIAGYALRFQDALEEGGWA